MLAQRLQCEILLLHSLNLSEELVGKDRDVRRVRLFPARRGPGPAGPMWVRCFRHRVRAEADLPEAIDTDRIVNCPIAPPPS